MFIASVSIAVWVWRPAICIEPASRLVAAIRETINVFAAWASSACASFKKRVRSRQHFVPAKLVIAGVAMKLVSLSLHTFSSQSLASGPHLPSSFLHSSQEISSQLPVTRDWTMSRLHRQSAVIHLQFTQNFGSLFVLIKIGLNLHLQ